MSARRKAVFNSSTDLTHALSQAYGFMDLAELEMARNVKEYIAQCHVERAQVRSKISADAVALADVTSSDVLPGISPCFLTYRFHKKALDVYWVMSSFTRGGKCIPRRVAQQNGQASMRDLLAHAHVDEVDVIRRHEEQARLFRAQWKEWSEVNRRLKSFREAHFPP